MPSGVLTRCQVHRKWGADLWGRRTKCVFQTTSSCFCINAPVKSQGTYGKLFGKTFSTPGAHRIWKIIFVYRKYGNGI